MSPIAPFTARFFLGLALSVSTMAQAGKVTLTVTRLPAGTPADARLTLGANVNGWNPADPHSILKKNADGTFSVNLDVPDGSVLEYKVTRGAWSSVEKNADGSEMANRTLKVQGDATVKLEVARWADAGTAAGTGTAGTVTVPTPVRWTRPGCRCCPARLSPPPMPGGRTPRFIRCSSGAFRTAMGTGWGISGG